MYTTRTFSILDLVIGFKMKIFEYLLLSGIIVLFTSFTSPEKKLEKIISKIWKGENYSLTEMELPDSLSREIQLFKSIYVDSQIVGYACYTTAFGCRVGGCAAPSNANVQSYETFDYIVVYDTKLNILKVDIADYGGSYGYEICNARWLKQFEGSNSAFKLGENVDGITGATVSATFLIDDLNAIGKGIKNYLEQNI